MGRGPSPFAEMNSSVNMGTKLDPRTKATNPRKVKPIICPAWQPKNTTFDLVGPRIYATGNQRGRVFFDQQEKPLAPLAAAPSDAELQIAALERALDEAKAKARE